LISTDVGARGIDVTSLPYVINYSLPEKPTDYIHRIGRVGRAERMGLAISLVAADEEKVWYHTCSSKGKGCINTDVIENKGCALWYDETELWKDIQNSLGITIPKLGSNYKFDENVIYGQKKVNKGVNEAILQQQQHREQLAVTVMQLATLENKIQKRYWELHNKKWK